MNTKLFALAALALSLAACTNDNEVTDNGPVAARVNAEISGAVATRASGTQWATGDQIGISTVEGTGTYYNNVCYEWNGSGFTTSPEKAIYFETTNDVVFRAYYPYDENGGTLNATTDGEAQKNQPKIDFLYATGATANTHNPTINFTDGTKTGGKDCSFHHCMSQISLTFEASDGLDFSTIKPTAYKLSKLLLEGSFDTATGIAKADENAQAADLDMPISSALSSSVILFPQEVQSIGLTVVFNGNEYNATLTVPEGALKAGNNYTYTVTVRNKGLSIDSAEITDWNPVSGGDVSAEL